MGISALCLSAIFLLSSSSPASGQNFDFSIEVDNDNVTLIRDDTAAISVSIELISGTAENISIHGEWVGNEPSGVSASLSPSTGTPPFTSVLTLTSSSTAEEGNFCYRVVAEGGGLTKTCDVQLAVITELIMTISTDNESYFKGQSIHVSGNVSYENGASVGSGNVTLTLSCEGWKRSAAVPIQDGTYEYEYTISFGDPDGTWSIKAESEDDSGNRGAASENISVELQEGAVWYTVEFFAPPLGAIYNRGDPLPISVTVLQDDESVENAKVNCILSPTENIALMENSPGVYSTVYTIPWDAQTENWVLSVEATKTVEGSLRAGGAYTSVTVKPANLKIEFLEPANLKFYPGDEIEVRVGVTYPDNSTVKNAEVILSGPGGDLTLSMVDNDTYGTTYVVGENEVGSLLLEVSAADPYGNSGVGHKVVTVAMPEEEIPTVIFLVPAGVALGLLPVFLYVRRRLSVSRLNEIRREMDEIRRLQKEAASKYFKEGSISRETYERLMHEHAERYSELQKEERKLRKK